MKNNLECRQSDKFLSGPASRDLDNIPAENAQSFLADAEQFYDRALRYLRERFNFGDGIFKTLSEFSLAHKPQSWANFSAALTALKLPIDLDEAYAEFVTIRQFFENMSDEEFQKMSTGDKWLNALRAAKAKELLHVAQYIMSIPASNAYVERVFSVMGQLWTDERNRMSVELVRSELIVFLNFDMTCESFLKYALTKKPLLNAIRSEKKYSFKT